MRMNSFRLKAILVAAAAMTIIVLCSWTVQVQAQSTTPEIGPTPRTINLTAEQGFIIREIVLKDLHVPNAQSNAPQTIGDAVPQSVELYPIPPEVAAKVPQVKSHLFFVKDDEIFLVSPSDRHISDVIKKPTD